MKHIFYVFIACISVFGNIICFGQTYGTWKTITCYQGLDFCVKKESYNEYAKKYMWWVKFRNRYQEDISFSFVSKERSYETAKTTDRITLAPGQEKESWFLVAEDTEVRVFVDNVRFGVDAGPYASCGGVTKREVENETLQNTVKSTTITDNLRSAGQSTTSHLSIKTLAACANGLRITLESRFLGACYSTANEDGKYFEYQLVLENASATALTYGAYNYFFKGSAVAPKGDCSFFSKIGTSTSINASGSSLAGYGKKEHRFGLGFLSAPENEMLVQSAVDQSKKFCMTSGSSLTPPASATSASQSSLQPDQKQIEKNKAEYARQNISDQKKRDASEKAAQASIFASMISLGGFMYNNLSKDSEKSLYNGGSWRFNFNVGYSFTSLPIYETVAQESYNGVTKSMDYSTRQGASNTLNLDLGLQFWPYYGDHFGVGVIAEGNAGYLPLAGENSSYTYNYGIQGMVGAASFKLSALYLMGDRGGSYSRVYSDQFGKSMTNVEGASKYSRFMVGPRFTFGEVHPLRNLEILYITERYANLKRIKGSGFNITYAANNRLRIYAETMLKAARVGVLTSDYLETFDGEVNNTGMYVRFGVVRMIDRFGQTK